MVGLLWDAGDVTAAIELEALWCELAVRCPFSLFCGYERPASMSPAELDAFATVCEQHSALVAGAPLVEATEVLPRFARSAHAPRRARQLLTEILDGWALAELVDDGCMILTELATNAILHANSDFTVAVTRRHDGVRLEVGDTSSVPPAVADTDSREVGGRGLHIVAGLAAAWGCDLVSGGKIVWADLDATTAVRRP
jgi:anti-sigma regulatory factor (Ser/Thr protein kinase)